MDRLGPMAGHEGGAGGASDQLRFGEKDEIALTAVFLSTKAAGFINGATIVADGGHWMLRPTLPKEIYQRTIRKAKL